MVASEDVFSVVALFVMFRETIEASIVVAILLQLVVRLGRPDLKKWVWWGVATGVGISIIIGVGFIIAFYVARTAIFADESPSAEIFAGVVNWIAAIVITILAFAMLRFLGWEAKWQRRLEATAAKALEAEQACATEEELAAQQAEHDAQKKAADRRDAWKVYFAIALVCLREGIEAVVFIAGVGNDKPSAIPLPALIGVACGVAVGVFLYYSGKAVKDIKWLFISMTCLLILMAAGQIANGMGALAEGHALGGPTEEEMEPEDEDGEPLLDADGNPVEGVPPIWYLKPLWDTSGCCGEDADENKFFALLHAVFGYQDKGTALCFILYFGYWIVVGAIFWWKWRNGTLLDADYKYTREMKKQELEQLNQQNLNTELSIIPLPELKAVLAEHEAAGEKEGYELKAQRSSGSSGSMVKPPAQPLPPV